MGTKITDLTALATAPDTLDVIAIVDVDDPAHAASGTTKKITIADLGFLATGADISLLNNDSGFITVSDFANNGENAGADRDLGNLDAFALSFITSGVGRINIAAGGNVGIGNSTPSEKLEVTGNAKISAASGTDNALWVDTTLASGGIYRHLKLSQTGATRLEVISTSTGTGFRLYDSTATIGVNLLSLTSGSPSWLALNGNLGIGTAAPTEKLEVVGNTKISGGIDVDSSTFFVNGTTHAFSLGYLATPETSIPDAVTIGYQANTLGSGRSIAIGRTASAVATGVASNIAIGYQAKAPSGDNVISIGDQSGSTITSNGNQTILMGYLAGNQTATIGTGTIAIGDQTDASGVQATIIGSGAKGTANWAIAIGRQAESLHSNGIAIGLRAETGAARAYVIASGTTGTVNSVADSLAVGFNEVTPRFLFSKSADSYLNGTGNVAIGTATATEKLTLDGRQFLSNQTAPGTPTAGGIIYVESGALKYIGSSGTITTLGVA